MRLLRNAAVAGIGVALGDMLAGFVVPMIPGTQTNPTVEKVARYALVGLTAYYALHLFGVRKSK